MSAYSTTTTGDCYAQRPISGPLTGAVDSRRCRQQAAQPGALPGAGAGRAAGTVVYALLALAAAGVICGFIIARETARWIRDLRRPHATPGMRAGRISVGGGTAAA